MVESVAEQTPGLPQLDALSSAADLPRQIRFWEEGDVLKRLIPVAALLGGLAWGEGVGDKPFPQWKDSTVLKVLTDSAWARSSRVDLTWVKQMPRLPTPQEIPGADPTMKTGRGSPIGGAGVPKLKYPPEADIIVRWTSALPVRQAAALYRARDEKLPEGRLNELVGAAGPDYVVEIRGVPAEVAHSGAESVEMLARESGLLVTRSGRVLKARKAAAVMQGSKMTVKVHFSREGALRVEEQEVEFWCDLQILKVKQRFRLREMLYLGGLEL